MRTRRATIESLEGRLFLDARFAAPVATATPADPQGITAADFNEDGKLDVAVTSFSEGTVSVLLGNGDGTFTLTSTFEGSPALTGVTAADLNEDNNVDLVAVGSDVAFFRGNGDGTFEAPTRINVGGSPQMAAVADLDADEHLDLAVPNPGTNQVHIIRGNGDGTFKTTLNETTVDTPVFITIAAVNNSDDDLDLVVAHLGEQGLISFDNGAVRTMINNGSADFTTVGESRTDFTSHPVGVAVADIDANGVVDIVSANGGFGDSPRGTDNVSVITASADGSLPAPQQFYPTGAIPQSVLIVDLDEDGKLDLLTANNGDGTITVIAGNGDRTFGASTDFAAGAGNGLAVTGDFNGDGHVDVVTAATNASGVAFLRNRVAEPPDPPDTANPTAVLGTFPVTASPGATSFNFIVNYSDDQAINAATLGAGDITVTGPSGNSLAATFVDFQGSSPTSIQATYRITPADGTFDATDAGTYTPVVLANAVSDTAGKSVTEGNLASFAIDVTAPGPQPDLTAEVIATLPASVVGGSKGKASVRVSNVGDAAFNASPEVALLLSTDAVADGGDVALGTPSTKPLKLRAGAGKVVKFKFNFPESASGTFFVLAAIDRASAVTESSKSNNSDASDTAVTVAAPFIDLGLSGGVAPVGALVPGKRSIASVLLENLGNVPFSGPATIELFASSDGVIDGGDAVLTPVAKTQKIKAGAAKTVRARLIVPSIAAGNYFILARVTSTGNFADGNAANDQTASSGTFTIAATAT